MLNASIGISVVAGLVPATSRTEKHQPHGKTPAAGKRQYINLSVVNNNIMTKIESTIREIAYPQQTVYAMLSDLSNIEKVKDRIPADKVNDLTFDANSISVNTQMGAVRLSVVERVAPKLIKFETQESPVPFNFWIQLLPVTEATSKMKLTISADLNPFIAGMVKKPLQEGIERIADALQAIKYE